jgi:polyhydroxybutyrate depolymerase
MQITDPTRITEKFVDRNVKSEMVTICSLCLEQFIPIQSTGVTFHCDSVITLRKKRESSPTFEVVAKRVSPLKKHADATAPQCKQYAPDQSEWNFEMCSSILKKGTDGSVSMQKPDITFALMSMVTVVGCHHPTYIAEELNDAPSTVLDTPSDSLTGPDTQTDSLTGPDTQQDSQIGLDTLPDSDTGLQNCEPLSPAPGDITRSIQVEGDTRTYVLHIPATYTEPAPLLIEYHAIGGSGESQNKVSVYPPVTDREGVIMAFPTGTIDSLGRTSWNIGDCCVDNIDDVAFTMAIIDDIENTVCIDRSRIYAAGLYIGGGLAYRLACQTDVFAAVASSAFDLDETNAEACSPARPITVVSFRTEGDEIMSLEPGPGILYPSHPLYFLGAVGTFEKWAEIDHCTGAPLDLGDGCQVYTQCAESAEVMLCLGQGPNVFGDASIAWSVLSRHSL